MINQTCRKFILFALALSFAGCISFHLPRVQIHSASETAALPWLQAVSRALGANPDLLAARSAIQSAARTRDIAAGDYLPAVDGSLEKSRTRAIGATGKDQLDLSVSAEQNFFNGFTTTGKVLSARNTLDEAKWNYLDTSANVRFRLRSAYIELLRLKKLLEVSRGIEERRKQNADMIELRYEAGREHLGSALRARAIYEQAAYEVRQIERQIEVASIRLSRHMGGEFHSKVDVEGDLEVMGGKTIALAHPDFAELAESKPAVIAAMKNAEAFKAAIVAVQGSVWPQLDGSASYGYSGDKARNIDERDESFLGLRLSIPFFNGGKNVNAIRKAKAEYESARENARSVRDEAIVQIAEAWTAYQDSLELIEVRRKFVEAARKRSEIVRVEYKTGLVNFQDFDIAEQDIADSETNYTEALAAVLAAQANWELMKGSTLEDALRETK